jgi:hypothetical protein
MPPEWAAQVVDVRSPELKALTDKFDSPSDISSADIGPCLQSTIIRTLGEIQRFNPDVVIATGFGADALAVIRARGLWIGAAVIVEPHGFYKNIPVLFQRDKKPIFSGNAVWVINGKDPGAQVGVGRDRADTIISTKSTDDAYLSGLIAACASLAYRRSDLAN